jgi:p-aminobenzoyl-glutamate transporter AbgT
MAAPVQRDSDVVSRDLGEEGAVLVHLGTGAQVALNPVGAAIWGSVDGRRDVAGVAAAVAAQVSGAPADLEAEVAAFLEGLRAHGMIR